MGDTVAVDMFVVATATFRLGIVTVAFWIGYEW
jgi:hypothetical protein